MDFEKELAILINKYSKENESDTPDFILALYLKCCLANYTETVRVRDAAIRKERADEIERLRKWQQEAVRWLGGARATMELVGAPKDMKDAIDRLIAEAQGD